MPIVTAGDIFREMQPKTPHAIKKDVPAIAENPNVDFNNHQSPNQNETIRRRTQMSRDGLGSTRNDESNTGGIGSNGNDGLSMPDILCSTGRDQEPDEDRFDGFDSVITMYWLLVPLFIAILGYKNTDKCPANSYIPYMVIVIGVLIFMIVGFICVNIYSQNFDCLRKNKRRVIKLSSVLLACVWIFELIQFFSMEASFESSAENYCDYSFYFFIYIVNAYVAICVITGLCFWFYDIDVFNRETSRSAYMLLPFESDSD